VRGALALLIVLNVSRVHQHFGFLAVLRPAMLLTIIALAYALLQPSAFVLRAALQTKPARLILLLGGLACLSAPFGLSLGGSGRYIIESYSKVIVAAVILIAAIRRPGDLYLFVWAYVIGCGVLAFFATFVFQPTTQGTLDNVARLSELYTFDANDICVVLLVGAGLAFLLLQQAGPAGKMVIVLTLIGMGATIARSGSRGGFLGLVATAAAMLVLTKGVSVVKRVAVVMGLVVALGVAAPSGYWARMEAILRPSEDYNWSSTDGRKQVFERGMGYMLRYPLFGLGMNNFWRAECLAEFSEKVRRRDLDRGIRCTAPHNTYVQAGAELGVPGLAIFLLLTIGSAARMLVLRRRLPAAWQHGNREERFLFTAPSFFAVAMVGFVVPATFVSFAWIDIVYILAAFTAGYEICFHRAHRGIPQASMLAGQAVAAGRTSNLARRSRR
jgi:O-antigen ligase